MEHIIYMIEGWLIFAGVIKLSEVIIEPLKRKHLDKSKYLEI